MKFLEFFLKLSFYCTFNQLSSTKKKTHGNLLKWVTLAPYFKLTNAVCHIHQSFIPVPSKITYYSVNHPLDQFLVSVLVPFLVARKFLSNDVQQPTQIAPHTRSLHESSLPATHILVAFPIQFRLQILS